VRAALHGVKRKASLASCALTPAGEVRHHSAGIVFAGESMIVELRTYTLHPGKVGEMVRLYGEEGLALQKRHLGEFLGYFTSESGNLNQVVFMWAYESLDDRAARRDRMAQDPEWQAYLARVVPLLVAQENKLLRPTAFSPIR
jgi:hypothetical protein